MPHRTILLIDDDPDILHMYSLKFSLEKELRLLTANTPEIGLSLARQAGPDLILLDLILPKRGGLPRALNKEVGFGILEKLKKSADTKGIPVVILTNLDEHNRNNVERAKNLGALDYWVKANHQPADIVRMVKNILSDVNFDKE